MLQHGRTCTDWQTPDAKVQMLPCSHLGEASITGDQEQKEDTGDYQGPEEERDRVLAALTVGGATAACRATEMYLMPLNCVLSNNENGELYGTCISLPSLKQLLTLWRRNCEARTWDRVCWSSILPAATVEVSPSITDDTRAWWEAMGTNGSHWLILNKADSLKEKKKSCSCKTLSWTHDYCIKFP